MQLFHHDNGDLEFVRRDIIGQSATELDETGDPKRSWLDVFQTLYPFNGYKSLPADAVQLAYSRHFHLEIHDILSEEARPPEAVSIQHPYVSAIADSRVLEITKAAKPKTIYDKMFWVLSTALFVELLIWGVVYAITKAG